LLRRCRGGNILVRLFIPGNRYRARPSTTPGSAKEIRVSCPICARRKPERFCPAKGEKICAICCGTEREVTIDCPSDCLYLVAARRYEQSHRKPVAPNQVPYPDVEFPVDLVHERRALLSGLGFTILQFAAENRLLDDAEVAAALGALAETHRTLSTGILYERPPEAPLPRALYGRLAEFLQKTRKEETEQTGSRRLKDMEIFYLLVFLLRVGRHERNSRPRSRAFLDFLRAQFPRTPAEAAPEPSRIILP
jgi:hypothetical protein